MSWFTSLSKVSRRRKLGLFYRTFQPNEYTRILDVGAEINPTGERGLQLIDTYRWKHNLTALNLSKDHICQIKRHYPQIEAVVGDACHLPWPDKYFDVVYSNAVIEHVGDYERQKQMAREIMRVGKRWFVCTPNRWYPFEFHLRLPLVTWLAGDAYLHAARVLRYDHAKAIHLCESDGGLPANELPRNEILFFEQPNNKAEGHIHGRDTHRPRSGDG